MPNSWSSVAKAVRVIPPASQKVICLQVLLYLVTLLATIQILSASAAALPLTTTNDLWMHGKLWMRLSNGACDLNVGYFNRTNPGQQRVLIRIQPGSVWRFRLAIAEGSGTRVDMPANWDQKQIEFTLHWVPTNGFSGTLTGMVSCVTCPNQAYTLPAMAYTGALALDSLGVWADSASTTDTNQQEFVYLDNLEYTIPAGNGSTKLVTNFFASGLDRLSSEYLNRTNGFDFGWSGTANASGASGEMGGKFVRVSNPNNLALPRVLDEQSFIAASPFKLEIARLGGDLRLTWPLEYAACQLQHRPDWANPPQWDRVTNAVTISDNQCVVTVQPGPESDFYRLASLPTVSFGAGGQTVWENSGQALIPVILSYPSSNVVTVGVDATGGSATDGVDYFAPSGTLTFPPGVTNQTVQVGIVNDSQVESDETLLLALHDPQEAVLAGQTIHTLAILDDETPTGGPTFQKYETFDTQADSASHGWLEYKSRINGNNFGFSNSSNAGGASGEGGGTIARAAEGGFYADTNLYGLLSTDRPISAGGRIKFANTSTASSGFRLGHMGGQNFDGSARNMMGFLIQESRVVPLSQIRASVRVYLSDGVERSTGNTELQYTGGNITFFEYSYDPSASNGLGAVVGRLRNSSSNVIYTSSVGLQAGDKAKLSLDSFGISTGNNTPRTDSMQAYIDNASYTAISYGAPVIRFASPEASGLETTTPAMLDVVLLAPQPSTVSVNYSVSGGSATGGGSDYTLSNGVLAFAPGETLKPILMPITNDGSDESDETVVVSLSNPTNAVLGNPVTHTYTIVDPRPHVTFTEANSLVLEDAGFGHIPVDLSWSSGTSVSVDYTVTGGTAGGGGLDYTLANGTLVFAPGQTEKSIVFAITYDGVAEADETIQIHLSNPVSSRLGSILDHTVTVVDTAPAVSFATSSRNGQPSAGAVTIPVLLAGIATNVVTVDYSVLPGGTAIGGGVDYSMTNGTLSFSVGETSKPVSITIANNPTNDGPKTILIGLSNPTQARLGSLSNHTFTIVGNISFADTNTVALWLFDESEYFYTTLTDAAQYQYDLNLMEGAHLTAGKFGRALSVASGSDYNVMYSGFSGSAAHDQLGVRPIYQPLLWGPTVAPEQILNAFTQTWTCEFWLKLGTTPFAEASIIELGHAYNPGVSFTIQPAAAGFSITNSYAGYSVVCPSAPTILTNGQWHHVAFTRSGGQVKHYLDGQLQSTTTESGIASTPMPAVVWPSSLDYDTLGMQKSWPGEQRRTNRFNVALGQTRRASLGLNGLIDEVRISKVLRYTASFLPGTFSRNYATGAPGPALPDGPSPLFAGNPSILQLGGRKHVFLDTQLFQSTSNLVRVMNPPTDRQQINITESMQGSVFERNGLIYMLMTDGYSSPQGRVRVRYSTNGIDFVTPNWGIYGNNDWVLYRQPMYGVAFRDINSNVASNEAFKLTVWVSNRGIYEYLSSDGIHWRRNETTMLPLVSGGMAENYWDDQRGYYSGLLKRDSSYTSPDCADGGKSAVGFRSAEALKSWPFTPLAHPHYEDWASPCVTCEGPTVFPETPVGEVFRTRAQKYAWAPDAYVAFIWRSETRKVDLAISRDGDAWTTMATNATSGPWYVAPFGGYVEVTSLHGLIRRGDELWQYVNYGTQPNSSGPYHYRIKQRLDGFTSLDAGSTPAVGVSKPFLFSGGKLTLNINATGGSARIGILDAAGNPIAGFGVGDCDLINANATAHVVTWQGNSTIGSLSNTPIKLKFEMANAKIYAMQFLPD